MSSNRVGLRVLVLGLPGSGKSTFAARLSRCLKISHIECDTCFWETGGRQAEPDIFLSRVRGRLDDAGTWIIEGHYNRCKELLAGRVDTVIWLDFGYGLVLRRWLARSLGTRDFGDWRWVLLKRRSLRESYAAACEAFKAQGAVVHRLVTPGEAESFLA